MRHAVRAMLLGAVLGGGCSGLWQPFLGTVPDDGAPADLGTGPGGTGTGPEPRCAPAAAGKVTAEHLHGVWGTSDKELWAVGAAGTALAWDGDGWKAEITTEAGTLHAVWGWATDYVLASGDSGVVERQPGRWKPVSAGSLGALLDITGSGSDNQIAVGTSGVVLEGTSKGFGLQADLSPGTDYTTQAVALQGGGLLGMAGQKTGSQAGFLNTFVRKAGSWQQDDNEAAAVPLYGVVFFDGKAWVGGAEGYLASLVPGGGATLSEMPTGTSLEIRRLRPSTTAAGFWGVGAGGLLFFADGKQVTLRSSGTTEALYDAWQSPEGTLWLVGENGTVRRCGF